MIRDTGTRSFIFESSICITSLKRKLTISKKKTTKMEKTFEKGDSDKAAEFLKDFSK